MVVINIVVSLHKNLINKLYNNIMERKKYKRKKIYKRKKSLKKTLDTIIEMKNSAPKIVFRAHNIVVTLRNKNQINRWLEIYPEGKYTINY